MNHVTRQHQGATHAACHWAPLGRDAHAPQGQGTGPARGSQGSLQGGVCTGWPGSAGGGWEGCHGGAPSNEPSRGGRGPNGAGKARGGGCSARGDGAKGLWGANHGIGQREGAHGGCAGLATAAGGLGEREEKGNGGPSHNGCGHAISVEHVDPQGHAREASGVARERAGGPPQGAAHLEAPIALKRGGVPENNGWVGSRGHAHTAGARGGPKWEGGVAIVDCP